MSLATVCGAIYLIVGVVTATLGLLAMVTGLPMTVSGPFFFTATGIPFGLLLMLSPPIHAILGILTGYLTALIYNLVARATRGILLEITTTDGREF